MKIKSILLSVIIAIFIISCGGNTSQSQTENTDSEEQYGEPEGDQQAQIEEVKAMLTASDIPTWDDGNNYFFFRADGTMGGGDASGEPSMYEGKWKLENYQFYWKKDSEQNWTEVSIETDGVDILVDGVRYKKASY